MEIAPAVHQVRMLGADAFLIAEERLTLIDAGMVGSRLTLERYLRRIGRRMDELERIICTHGHPDHIGGLRELVRDRTTSRSSSIPTTSPASGFRSARPGAHRRPCRSPGTADPVPDPRAGGPDADRRWRAHPGPRRAARGPHARPHAGQRLPLRRADRLLFTGDVLQVPAAG